MKGARFHSPGTVTVDELPEPVAGPGELVVRVRAASICGTDRRIAANGHFKLPDGTPRVLGHEFAGDVARDQAEAAAIGIRGVPFVVVAGRYGLSGAQDPAAYRELLAAGLAGIG